MKTAVQAERRQTILIFCLTQVVLFAHEELPIDELQHRRDNRNERDDHRGSETMPK
jgi:hypothetical protein